MAISNHGGAQSSATDSTPSPSQKPVTLSAPRMLTPSEQDWLRQHAKETAEQMREILRQKKQEAA